jgi:hypothetical protein
MKDFDNLNMLKEQCFQGIHTKNPLNNDTNFSDSTQVIFDLYYYPVWQLTSNFQVHVSVAMGGCCYCVKLKQINLRIN